ncbi:putative RNA-directed DNA polymerase from transposon X-element [Trichonephila clavipes]|nr:putative RNA-directed DNA polymerase from transposon X-element [Trichonephila clavipes]
MTSFISCNCRGLRSRLPDFKSIISTYQPACVALQETFLKSTMTMRVRGYNCVRLDVDGDASPTGGVCIFTRSICIPVLSSHCTHRYRLWLAVDDAVLNVTEAIRNVADAAIPNKSNLTRKLGKPWWNSSCQQAKKEQRKAWGIFRRYPTTENLIAFKRAKALACRIRCQCQRESWITTPIHIALRLEWTPMNFRCRQSLPYNCDFDMWELKRALSSAHSTSPGPDGISYELLRHLNENSLISLLYLCNRIWREQAYPTQWQEAIVILILKPEKDPKNPLSYRPIALTSCLCKTLERMASFYVDDLQISCEGSDIRMIERQLQTAVNNIVKCCNTNGHSISASKSCCVHFCRKRGIHHDPEIRIRDVQIPVVPRSNFQPPAHFPSAYFTIAEEV